MEKMMEVIGKGTVDMSTEERESMMDTKHFDDLNPSKEDILMMEETVDLYEMESECERDAAEGKGTEDEESLYLDNSVRLYLAGINQYALLSPEEERSLGMKIKEGGEGATQAKKRFMESNLRLVYHIAKMYCDRGVDLEDLNAMGVEGLHKAVEKFDPAMGYKFSTYASWWIRQAILRGISDEVGTIRIPSHMKENIRKINKANETWKLTSEKEPTVKELADLSGLTEEQVKKANRAMYTLSFLDMQVGEDGETTLGELLADEKTENPETAALNHNLREMIELVLSQLDPREARVLSLRYGIGCPYPMSLEEVARLPEFKVTRERVRQIETKALHKIRRSTKMRGLLKAFAA